MAKYRYHAFAALSGLLLALAYPGWGFDLGWLAWIGFVPLFFAVGPQLPRTALGNQRAVLGFVFKIGLIAGLIYFLIIFRWFWSIYPLDTLGIESGITSFIIVFLVWLISSAGMAVFWGLFGLALGIGVRCQVSGVRFFFWNLKPGTWNLILLAPAIFVFLEYARSWGFGFLWAGSGSLFGPHWTMGNLTYALADNPLILKLASFTGIYGITFVIIFVNCLIFTILKRASGASGLPRAALGARAALGVLVILLISFGPRLIKFSVTQQEESKQINFAIIQTAQPTRASPSPQETLAGLEEQLKLLNKVAKEHPENRLIVFPETSELFKGISLFMTSAQAKEYFNNLFKEPAMIIAGGRVFDKNGQFYSRVFDLDTQKDILNYYDKRLLTPGGEFLPYPIKFIAWLFSKTTTSQFDNLRELNVGTKDVSTVNFRDQFKVAPMICSELLSPGLTKQTSQNSDVIVSMASYGVFHGNQTIARQMLAATRFRAAEMARPVITAANLGRSYVIDSQGNIAFLAPDSKPQLLTGSIALNPIKTWYNRWGDIPVLLGCLALIATLATSLLVWRKMSNF